MNSKAALDMGTAPSSLGSAARLATMAQRVFVYVRLNATVVIALAIATVLVLVPVVSLVSNALRLGYPTAPGPWTLQHFIDAFSQPRLYETLLTTLIYAAPSTVVSVVCAFGLAWLTERTNIRGRGLIWVSVLIPMAMPGVVFAMSWILLLSPKVGLVNVILREPLSWIGIDMSSGPLDIYSMAGMIFLESLRGVTTLFLIFVGALRMMDPSLEEAGRVSGASSWRVSMQITARVLRPAIMVAAIYSFMSNIESFDTPLAVGTPAGIYVFSTLVYQTSQANGFDFGLAGAYSSVFLLISLLLVILYHKVNGDSRRWSTVSGKAFRPRQVDLGRGRYVAYLLVGVFGLVSVVLPLLILLWTSLTPFYQTPTIDRLSTMTFGAYADLFNDALFFSALKNTLVLVIATPLLTMILAMLVSWFVVRSRSRVRYVVDAVVFFAHGIPGVVIGLAIIVAYLKPPLNSLGIYGTVAIVVVGLSTSFIAYTTRVCNTAITQIHRELEEAAHVSGARQLKTIVFITLPLIRPAFVSGLVWVGIHSFKALTLPLMLQGPDNQLISVRMWTLWSQGQSAQACALAVFIVVVLGALAIGARRSMERVVS